MDVGGNNMDKLDGGSLTGRLFMMSVRRLLARLFLTPLERWITEVERKT